ncbi:MAG: glycoside-pentoside-hexuronide (GPH):cation symporter [Lachnospiraceae bacterium]|nr:glycoside-pentoside-hexuronide (GPH):cation symporter [Lachnospiraceae bacterium]
MEKLTKKEKPVYTASLLGQNMIYSFVSMYVMFFFTDLLHIPTQTVTILLVVASLWDAVNDPIMGIIADKTKTRIGKFRPYLLIGPCIIAITTILCFSKFGGSAGGTIIIAAICYILWGMSYTMCDIPIWAISSVVTRDSDEKNNMVTLGKIGGTIGTVIISVGSVSLLNLFGGERNIGAYGASAAIVAVIGAVLMILSGLCLRERIALPKEKIAFKRNIHTILDNKPLKALLITLLAINMVNNIRQVVQVYFAVYVWGSSIYVTYQGLSLVIGMIFGMAISPGLIRKFEKKKIFITACVAGAIASVIPFVVNAGPGVGLVFLGISFAFTGITTIVSTSMLMDAIDYSEYKLGFRGEGLVFSMNTFLNKLGSTFSKAILGVSMTIMGYVDNMTATEPVKIGFSLMIYVVPMICFILAIIPILFYTLNNEELVKIRSKINNQ